MDQGVPSGTAHAHVLTWLINVFDSESVKKQRCLSSQVKEQQFSRYLNM